MLAEQAVWDTVMLMLPVNCYHIYTVWFMAQPEQIHCAKSHYPTGNHHAGHL